MSIHNGSSWDACKKKWSRFFEWKPAKKHERLIKSWEYKTRTWGDVRKYSILETLSIHILSKNALSPQ